MKTLARSGLGFLMRLRDGLGRPNVKYEKIFGLEARGVVEGKPQKDWEYSYYGANRDIAKRRAQRIARVVAGLRPRTVLEPGCAFGYVLNEVQLATRARCTGVEMQRNAVRLGKKKFPKLRLINANCLSYSPKQKFDVVFTSSFLSYTNRPIAEQCFKRFSRLGKFVVVCEVMAADLDNKQYFETKEAQRDHPYCKFFEENGLRVVAEERPSDYDPRTIMVGVHVGGGRPRRGA